MTKKNLILAIVLIILIAMAYIYQVPFKKWREQASKPENFLAKVDMDQINKIEIKKAGQTTLLEKINSRWKVGGTKDFYVQDYMATNLISQFKKAGQSSIELVSKNKAKKQELQTDDQGTNIKLMKDGQEVISLIIGKAGDDFMSSYVSLPNSEKTYAVKANLNNALAASDWRDKTIFVTDKEKINKIRFQYPTREFTIEKKDNQWQGILPYKFKVNTEKVAAVLNIISSLAAASIPEQNFTGTGLEKSQIIVQATGDGIDNTIMIGSNNGNELYYAKKGDSDNIYLISKEERDSLDKQIRDLQ